MAALALLLALAACRGEGEEPAPSSPVGPLQIEGGGEGLLPAPAHETTAVFGALFPCTTTGQAVTVTGIRYDSDVPPVEVYSALRTIPERADREDPDANKWRPNLAIYGDPKRPRMQERMAGELLIPMAGQKIEQDCDRDPDEALTELLTVVRSSTDGAYISGQTLIYESDGVEYEAPINWRFGFCGSDYTSPRCPS